MREGKGERGHVAGNSLKRLPEFASILSIPTPRIRSQPVVRMGLENRGACSPHFSSFPSKIARSTYVVHTTMWRWKLFTLTQGSLASGLLCCIHIDDYPMVPQPIPQSAGWRRFLSTRHQIRLKQRAQSLHTGLIDGCEKTAQGRRVGQ